MKNNGQSHILQTPWKKNRVSKIYMARLNNLLHEKNFTK